MNKREFKQLLQYLKFHPGEAAQLREVLGVEEPITQDAQQDDLWLSAAEAGKQVGKSSTWIRRKFNREGLFRPARKEARGKYLFSRNRVIADYNSYMMTRSRSI